MHSDIITQIQKSPGAPSKSENDKTKNKRKKNKQKKNQKKKHLDIE